MVKTCEKCGKELPFLSEESFELPDRKKMIVCNDCKMQLGLEQMKPKCKICGKSIEEGHEFIMDGELPKILRKILKGLDPKYTITNLIELIRDMSKGNLYHRECFIKEIKEESKK